MIARETALIVEVPEADALVGRWRDEHDPVARLGVPAHITVLFPFVPAVELTSDAVEVLARVCATSRRFEFRLDGIERFPDAVWLRPVPGEPFRSLTRSIWTHFPDFPPYGGRFPDLRPHLTVAKLAEPEQADFVRRLTGDVGGRLPVTCAATAVSLFAADGSGGWQREHVFPLGAEL